MVPNLHLEVCSSGWCYTQRDCCQCPFLPLQQSPYVCLFLVPARSHHRSRSRTPSRCKRAPLPAKTRPPHNRGHCTQYLAMATIPDLDLHAIAAQRVVLCAWRHRSYSVSFLCVHAPRRALRSRSPCVSFTFPVHFVHADTPIPLDTTAVRSGAVDAICRLLRSPIYVSRVELSGWCCA